MTGQYQCVFVEIISIYSEVVVKTKAFTATKETRAAHAFAQNQFLMIKLLILQSIRGGEMPPPKAVFKDVHKIRILKHDKCFATVAIHQKS